MNRIQINLLIDYGSELPLSESLQVEVEKAVTFVLEREGLEGDFEVSLSLVTSNEIQLLNKKYRGVDAETDVLSFPICPEDFPGPKLLGDIVISMDRVKLQAREYGHSEGRELLYLIVHSMFHLLGYDHMDEVKKKHMRQGEKEVMKRLGVHRYEA